MGLNELWAEDHSGSGSVLERNVSVARGIVAQLEGNGLYFEQRGKLPVQLDLFGFFSRDDNV